MPVIVGNASALWNGYVVHVHQLATNWAVCSKHLKPTRPPTNLGTRERPCADSLGFVLAFVIVRELILMNHDVCVQHCLAPCSWIKRASTPLTTSHALSLCNLSFKDINYVLPSIVAEYFVVRFRILHLHLLAWWWNLVTWKYLNIHCPLCHSYFKITTEQ